MRVKSPLEDEGIYYHNLALTRVSAMPSVLIEALYIMIPEHEALMRTEDYPCRLTRAIFKGLRKFVRQRKQNN